MYLIADLAAARQECEAARKQHEWLSSEARQTEEEIAQYEAYMGSKAQREQKKLKSLNEHNTVELSTIAAEKKSLEESFAHQKQGIIFINSMFMNGNLDRVHHDMLKWLF